MDLKDLKVSDLKDHVILPREDFIEITTAAFDTPQSVGARIGTTVQTTIFVAACAGAFGLGSWAYYKAADWYETRKFQRDVDLIDHKAAVRNSK